MLKKITLFCVITVGVTNFVHSQSAPNIPNTIYGLNQDYKMVGPHLPEHFFLADYRFRILDKAQLMKGNFVVNFTNMHIPATSFAMDSYRNLERDRYFFKGYDLYEMHSAQYANWKNQQRIEQKTAKALAKSYRQFGKLNP
ncbi:hypothetical protein MWU59_05300 [Flavobacteriaceae bacterium F08102]|nr:hypothetical protein [Flavobacteriaceae bacterium F08102]